MSICITWAGEYFLDCFHDVIYYFILLDLAYLIRWYASSEYLQPGLVSILPMLLLVINFTNF